MPASALPLFYGADNGGIVCAYAFKSGHVDTLNSEAAAHWLQHHPAEAFLWIHVNLSHNQALPWLQQHTALPELFYIGGLFGINVGGIPLAENPHGFGLLVLLVSVGVVAPRRFFLPPPSGLKAA